MKFKYNYLTNQLWKLDGEYSYEVCESNHFHTFHGIYGSDGFRLGEREWITFTFSHTNLTVYYQNGINSYQKTLDFPNTGEIVFEFTKQDRINSS